MDIVTAPGSWGDPVPRGHSVETLLRLKQQQLLGHRPSIVRNPKSIGSVQT
jgi:hypothetical protein